MTMSGMTAHGMAVREMIGADVMTGTSGDMREIETGWTMMIEAAWLGVIPEAEARSETVTEITFGIEMSRIETAMYIDDDY